MYNTTCPTRDPTLAIVAAMCGSRHWSDSVVNAANPTYRAYCDLLHGGHTAAEIISAALAAERAEAEVLAASTPCQLLRDVLPRYLLALRLAEEGG